MRSMIAHTKQAWWLNRTGSIFGFDGEGDGGSGEGGEGSGEGAGTGEGGSGEGEEGAGGSSSGEGEGEDTAGLKSALEKERADRKKLEKELKVLQKAEQAKADAEKSEVDRLKGENDRNAEKATKLAAGFKKNAVNSAILKAAAAAKFADPTDALRPEIFDAIGVEQDDDDPTDIIIDDATVTAAIKKLAKDKPHWLAAAQTKLPKSGSTFGGSGNSNTKGDPEREALKLKYPALRGL